jgi:hypothetical protein
MSSLDSGAFAVLEVSWGKCGGAGLLQRRKTPGELGVCPISALFGKIALDDAITLSSISNLHHDLDDPLQKQTSSLDVEEE